MEYRSSYTEPFLWPAFELKKCKQQFGEIGGNLRIEEYKLSTIFRIKRKGIYYLVPFYTWLKYDLEYSGIHLHEVIINRTINELKNIDKNLILSDDNCFLDSYKEERKTYI